MDSLLQIIDSRIAKTKQQDLQTMNCKVLEVADNGMVRVQTVTNKSTYLVPNMSGSEVRVGENVVLFFKGIISNTTAYIGASVYKKDETPIPPIPEPTEYVAGDGIEISSTGVEETYTSFPVQKEVGDNGGLENIIIRTAPVESLSSVTFFNDRRIVVADRIEQLGYGHSNRSTISNSGIQIGISGNGQSRTIYGALANRVGLDVDNALKDGEYADLKQGIAYRNGRIYPDIIKGSYINSSGEIVNEGNLSDTGDIRCTTARTSITSEMRQGKYSVFVKGGANIGTCYHVFYAYISQTYEYVPVSIIPVTTDEFVTLTPPSTADYYALSFWMTFNPTSRTNYFNIPNFNNFIIKKDDYEQPFQMSEWTGTATRQITIDDISLFTNTTNTISFNTELSSPSSVSITYEGGDSNTKRISSTVVRDYLTAENGLQFKFAIENGEYGFIGLNGEFVPFCKT